MSKYQPLWDWVKENGNGGIGLTFEEIENVLGFPIDHSFPNCKKELKEWGNKVGKISMKERTVKFERI